ncbi:MAG: hypothetical protein ABL958_04700, partial [Bdellovibrionia bacterium]
MNAQRVYVFIIVAAVAGFFAGKQWPRPHAAHPTEGGPVCDGENPSCDQKLEALKSKFQSISEKDIDEYIKLKDMKTKYEKADEIFGKILSIFLLDLGMRVSGQKLDEWKQASPPSRTA